MKEVAELFGNLFFYFRTEAINFSNITALSFAFTYICHRNSKTSLDGRQ
jgi:hypothetical protein